MTKPRKTETGVVIPGVERQTIEIWLVGDSPLIVKAWDPISRASMLRKQMKMPSGPKAAKDPTAALNHCFYVHDGRYVFPATALKKAAVGAARFVEAKMTEARGMFFVLGTWVPIHGSDPVAREDMVRVQGTADIRYRPMFEEWAMPIQVEFNSAFVQPAQVLNMFETAGFGVGIGEWRPEKNGPYGRFHVAKGAEGERFASRIPPVKTLPVPVDVSAAEVAS
jgi:hypothetical protein